jgi:multicomponent K+:H+ antiporter subunit A
VGSILETAGQAILGTNLPAYRLAVWHGFTLALLMSLIALAGGIGYYLLMHRRRRTTAAPTTPGFTSNAPRNAIRDW